MLFMLRCGGWGLVPAPCFLPSCAVDCVLRTLTFSWCGLRLALLPTCAVFLGFLLSVHMGLCQIKKVPWKVDFLKHHSNIHKIRENCMTANSIMKSHHPTSTVINAWPFLLLPNAV